MVKIGNTTLPGVETTVESARSVGLSGGSPGEVGIVGQADFTEGLADPNTTHRITSASRARTQFGTDSALTQQVTDALREGAFPVYATPTAEVDVASEDITGASADGALVNAPVSENAADTAFVINGTSATTVITYDDPAAATPSGTEVYLNPVTGEFQAYEAPSTSGDVAYTSFDYDSAIAAIANDEGETLDFIGLVQENQAAVQTLVDTLLTMEGRYEFAIGVAGAGARVDPAGYTHSFDTSRLQLIYPSRNADDQSIIGSYLGLRSALGITASPMRKRLASQTDLAVSLSQNDQVDLLAKYVNPLADSNAGARIVEDVTTVSDANTDESEMRQGFSRLVMDFVTLIVEDTSDGFIGELHTPSARNALQSIIRSELKDLLTQNSILAYSVSVQEVDSLTASVDVGVETTKPLRNIIATVTAGQVD